MEKIEKACFLVVYHLQIVSRKSGWKVKGKRHFGYFQWKKSWSKVISEKVVLCFRTKCFKGKFVFNFLKAIFDTRFRVSRPFFGKWLICAIDKRYSGAKFSRSKLCLPFTHTMNRPVGLHNFYI